MNWAAFPGSFNPWHKGHDDIVEKALTVFDKVYLLQCENPLKDKSIEIPEEVLQKFNYQIEVIKVPGLLSSYLNENRQRLGIKAVIRGLRNSQDFEYEKTQQYWYEDTGLQIPIFYVISDRALTHISSSAIRSLEKFK